ncbi:MAG: hypothetical protein UV78_C0033G0007 [Parcubacteria group bacterium GW2011_GWA2_43_17]|nr:MAG: hypothetical protein UV78_C0033G0007 [Parcubacteria group bacterium GW2011_GWA2_43_17]KKT93044.1 MAG: hypothetical protein UW91_C0013G0007 [Parcubacteria group bacterium GW2011_GWF2_45_11]OGY93459.1 MAG: hypothetical protein A2260_00510 [Candidatus Komeilibacteria bacterium RIFOXYA2_FULL_45_9]OGY96089.1 MAG: hypothetical protein A3J95_03265 [Candidatus Komeilibacteria bacterium RIFOXYC2_FULL_45_12]HAH04587.1 hypothetical protein [Candidatus Komeilibacteria bacterium]
MDKNRLKIFEYELKKEINVPGGFQLSRKEINAFQILNEKIKMNQGVKNDVIKFDFFKDKTYISTSSFVGVLKAGGKSIQIIPKLAKGNEDSVDYSRQAVRNLLYMLQFTKQLRIKEVAVSDLTQYSDDFYEVLIHLFTKNLLQIVKNGFNKEYVRKEDNLFFIKGKIVFNEHLRSNLADQSRFYLHYDEFYEDTPLNRIFKYAVHLMIKSTNNFSNLKLLQELQFIFSDIEFQKISREDINRIRFNRLNNVYEPVFNLAKLFLTNSSLELSVDKIRTFSFVFDMNLLFEEFIGEFIKKEFKNTYLKITLQGPSRYFVENKIINDNLEGPVFQLKPDIQLYSDVADSNPDLIIDTKYKILNTESDRKEGVDQSDLYQMNAYSKKYNCGKIILLYPRLADQANKEVVFKIDDGLNIYIRTVDVCRDLKRERLDFKQELESIVRIN